MITAALGLIVVATLTLRAARPPLQASTAAIPLQGNAPVQTLSRANQIVVSPGQKGATYYWLESQTKKLTTRFPGATATAERDAYGTLSTTLTDPSGNESDDFRSNCTDGIHDVLTYVHLSGAVLKAAGDPARTDPRLVEPAGLPLWKDKVDLTVDDARMAERDDAAEGRRPSRCGTRDHRARNRVDRRACGKNCPEAGRSPRSRQRSIRRRRCAGDASGRP